MLVEFSPEQSEKMSGGGHSFWDYSFFLC